jgi:hypothetical protein
MKKIAFLLLTLSAFSGRAQNFEGIITWKVSMEITDPKMKAQMAEAQKKMNDPAAQAQMKEMQEKMNDPEFKAMMESNPQLKAQMEAAMKMMQGGDMNGMAPSKMVVKIKNENAVMLMDGMMKMETLFLKGKNTSYKINRDAKTYSILPPPTEDPNNKVDIKITKTGETAKVLEYACSKYSVDVTSKGHTITYFVWTTTAIKDFDLKALARQRMGNQETNFYEKLEGVPLKTEMTSPQGKMTMECAEIKKQSLPSSEFEIPSGFKEVPYSIY